MFEDILRSYWLNGLNAITGNPTNNLFNYFENKKGYACYSQIQQAYFELSISDYPVLLNSIAFDVNRFACASIESLNDVHYKRGFPNSHAWKCIKCYYASYYSAHAILRMFGESCTNLEGAAVRSIEQVADLYGYKGHVSIQNGYYLISIDTINNLILCSKISTSGRKGSHEQLWEVFLNFINRIIIEIKRLSPTPEVQKLIDKITDLRNNLTYLGSSGGNWLSKVRNEINYKQLNGVWFPYKDIQKYFESIPTLINKWALTPELVDINIYQDKPILRYLSSCVFITTLCMSIAKEMSTKCPKGKSFHQTGVLELLNRIK